MARCMKCSCGCIEDIVQQTRLGIRRLVRFLRTELEGEKAVEGLTRLQVYVLEDPRHGQHTMGQVARYRGVLPAGRPRGWCNVWWIEAS